MTNSNRGRNPESASRMTEQRIEALLHMASIGEDIFIAEWDDNYGVDIDGTDETIAYDIEESDDADPSAVWAAVNTLRRARSARAILARTKGEQ